MTFNVLRIAQSVSYVVNSVKTEEEMNKESIKHSNLSISIPRSETTVSEVDVIQFVC